MTFNIYMTGVGGQGIGMLSEVLLRAADYAGHDVKAVDTHGLAQRGGMVVSHLRMGKRIYAPLIPKGEADLAVSLERHEAFRGMIHMLKPGGVLIYYDAVWQPLSVRLGQTKTVTESDIRTYADEKGIRIIPVFKPDLSDARMQNIVTLAHIHRNQLIPEITAAHYLQAMTDLMTERMLEKNRRIFDEA